MRARCRLFRLRLGRDEAVGFCKPRRQVKGHQPSVGIEIERKTALKIVAYVEEDGWGLSNYTFFS